MCGVGEEITREAKKARKTGGLAGSSSDESESESDALDNEESDNESSKFLSSGDDDDFNPFRDESSEDDEDGKGTWIHFIEPLAIYVQISYFLYEFDLSTLIQDKIKNFIINV